MNTKSFKFEIELKANSDSPYVTEDILGHDVERYFNLWLVDGYKTINGTNLWFDKKTKKLSRLKDPSPSSIEMAIITSTEEKYLLSYSAKISHYDRLWLPERGVHPQEEASIIHKFIKRCLLDKSPYCEIYTMSEVAVNLVGHMISKKVLTPSDIQVIIVPENQISTYDSNGFLKDWPYGFYNWSYGEIVGEE